jgi:hypothetical protein
MRARELLARLRWLVIASLAMAQPSLAVVPAGRAEGAPCNWVLAAYLNGANELPPVTTNGFGSARLLVHPAAGLLIGAWGIADLSSAITQVSIDRLDRVTGTPAIVAFVGTPAEAGVFTTTTAVSGALLNDLLADPKSYSVNIQTTFAPRGEIRGQLACAPEASATMLGASLSDLSGAPSPVGAVHLVPDREAGAIVASFTLGDMGAEITGIDLRRSSPNAAAPSIATFGSVPSAGRTFTAVARANVAVIDQIVATPGDYTIVVHTATRPVGAARGQLTIEGPQQLRLPVVDQGLPLPPTPTPTATPVPPPLLADDFDQRRHGWIEEDVATDALAYRDGAYNVLVKRGPFYSASLIDVGRNEWSLLIRFVPQGSNDTRRFGIAFGSSGQTCNAAVPDCYRFYLSSNGEVLLVYQAPDGSTQSSALPSGPAPANGHAYLLRVDHRLDELAAWLSGNGGGTWQSVARTRLDAGRARGTFVGVAVSAGEDTAGTAEASFDDLRLWPPGQLAPPTDLQAQVSSPSGRPVTRAGA